MIGFTDKFPDPEELDVKVSSFELPTEGLAIATSILSTLSTYGDALAPRWRQEFINFLHGAILEDRRLASDLIQLTALAFAATNVMALEHIKDRMPELDVEDAPEVITSYVDPAVILRDLADSYEEQAEVVTISQIVEGIRRDLYPDKTTEELNELFELPAHEEKEQSD